MSFSRTTRGVLLAFTGLVLLFIHAPLALVVLNSFNTSRTFEWPPPGFTTRWWSASRPARSAGAGMIIGERYYSEFRNAVLTATASEAIITISPKA